MADSIILVDTNLLVDYFRKGNRSGTRLNSILESGIPIAIPGMVYLEIYAGSNQMQKSFWDELLREVAVIDIDFNILRTAVDIHHDLRRRNKLIPIDDLLIAATAVSKGWPLATENVKHFERVEGIHLI